jgi:hypothetical protein
MKKLFLAFMLVAAVATSFVSCRKTTTDSDTYTQKFTLGATSFDINNAFTIESIKDSSLIYNAIVLAQGDYVGTLGSKTKGAIIVFRGDFTPGTHNLVFDPQQPLAHFPMYIIAEHEVDNIINFSLDNLLNQADVYVADNGSFTLEMDQDQFTVTTSNIEVKNVKDLAQVKTSSVDFEDNMLRYVLSTVEEGNFNGTNVVTAGRTKLNILSTLYDVVAFITANGDLIGFISGTPFDNGIPEGTYSNDDNSIIYLQRMSLQTLKFASSGEASVARNGDTYTIDMTGLAIDGISGTPTMHYVGTMPNFDFPFPEE